MPVTFIGLHFIFMFIGLFEIIISFSLLLLMCSCSRLLQAGKVGEWEKGPPARLSRPAGAGARPARVPLPAAAACNCCLRLLPALPALPAAAGWTLHRSPPGLGETVPAQSCCVYRLASIARIHRLD